MAAVTSNITPATRTNIELLETLAITDAGATGTVSRALSVPAFAHSVKFVIDITITGTTPLFDFKVQGATPFGADGLIGALLDTTTSVFELNSITACAITQLTTNNSTPIVTIDIGPWIQAVDSTGSATANCGYAFPATLPPWLVYTYVYDGTTHDEDYNGTIVAIWYP